MRRLRVGLIGAAATTERMLIPLLSGFDGAPQDDDWKRGAVAANARNAPPLLVALAAASRDEISAARVLAQSARLPPAYDDWRAMLRENQLDAVLCAAAPETSAQLLITLASWRNDNPAPRAIWLSGPPAPSSAAALQLAQMMRGRDFLVWCAQPLRHEFAHRAALRLIERDFIGAISSLDFRGATSFPLRVLAGETAARHGAASGETHAFAAVYESLALLLSLGGGNIAEARLAASRRGEAFSLWLQFAAGTLLSARFCAADAWNASLPRLEICGSDGRFLVCEGGRRLWQHEPQSAARLVEPPLSSPRLFGAGVAEDARAFFAHLAQSHGASSHFVSAQPAFSQAASTRTAAESAQMARRHDLASAIRALRLLEAAAQCARDHRFATLERDGTLPRAAPPDETSLARQRAMHAKTAPPLFAVPPKNAREIGEEKSHRETASIDAEAASHLTLPW